MSQDKLQRLVPGDPMPSSAAFWNQVIDLAGENPGSDFSPRQRIKNNPAMLKVQVADGSSVAQWTPCVLGEPVSDTSPFITDKGYVPLMKVLPAYAVTGIQRRNLGRIVVPIESLSGTDVVWAAAAGFVPGTVQMLSGRPITRRLTPNPSPSGAQWLGLDPTAAGYQIPAGGELMWWDAGVAAGGNVAKALIRIPGYTPTIWFGEGPQPLFQETSVPAGGGATNVGPMGLTPIGGNALFLDWASGGGIQIKGPCTGIVRAHGYVKFKPGGMTGGSAIASGSGVTSTKYLWANPTANATLSISGIAGPIGLSYPVRHYVNDSTSSAPDPGFCKMSFWLEAYFDSSAAGSAGGSLNVSATADVNATQCSVACTMSVSIMEETLHNQTGRSIPLA